MDKAFTELAKIRAAEPAPVIEAVQPVPVGEEIAAQEVPAEDKAQKRRGGLWVVIGAVVLIVVGALGLLKPKETKAGL